MQTMEVSGCLRAVWMVFGDETGKKRALRMLLHSACWTIHDKKGKSAHKCPQNHQSLNKNQVTLAILSPIFPTSKPLFTLSPTTYPHHPMQPKPSILHYNFKSTQPSTFAVIASCRYIVGAGLIISYF